MQQDKIMRTASYPPSQIEVPAEKIEQRTNETRDVEIIARNRNTDEQHETEETTYTIRMSPYLTSFRELGQEHDAEECKNIENLRDVIFKIRDTPELGSQIIRSFVERIGKA